MGYNFGSAEPAAAGPGGELVDGTISPELDWKEYAQWLGNELAMEAKTLFPGNGQEDATALFLMIFID